MKRISILAAVLLWCGAACAQGLIPQPAHIEPKDGVFRLTPTSKIFCMPDVAPLARYLSEYLPGSEPFYGIPGHRSPSVNSQIRLAISPDKGIPTEGYTIHVTENSVRITGGDYGGLFNGIQTFLQLLPAEVYSKTAGYFGWEVGCVEITDYPRFPYRGVMLDVARTFVPKADVMRFIDNASHHKINKLHWHLADDEGWRIEIKSYPRLTSIGAFRGGDSPVKPIYGAWDRCYGGYYTQDDVREIVAYAAARNVEIIPEIDLPGHSRAAAIAYPEILCNYTPDLTATAGYDRRNVWCVAREDNYKMLSDILTEIAELFPSGHIHLGGDEVEPEQWSHCPDCKALMKKNGLGQPVELEDIFMERAVGMVHDLGKEAVVWIEASYRNKLDRSATVSAWKGDIKTARKAAAAGYPTVVMPGSWFYFDMKQSPTERGHIWAGIVSPGKVYSFDFATEGFTDAEMKNVVGVEAAFFSELLLSNGLDYLDYQMYPRVCALSELTWTPQEQRNWTDFENRLTSAHYARMDAMGIKYRTGPAPAAKLPPKKTPAAALTSSANESARYPFSNAVSYSKPARTSRTCHNGDWFLWTFAAPVTCETVRVATGYEHLQRAGVPCGYVEVSYDGHSFEKAGQLTDGGQLTFRPAKALRAVRIVSETQGNGEPFVIIQPLEIR